MTRPDVHAWIGIRYAELAEAASEQGIKRTDARDTIAAELERAVQAGEFDVPMPWAGIVGEHLQSLDDKDRSSQAETLLFVADALDDRTILGRHDPILKRVCAVGRGLRKTYAYLSEDDLFTIIETKQAHVVAAADAVQKVTKSVGKIRRVMREEGAETIVGLFP